MEQSEEVLRYEQRLHPSPELLEDIAVLNGDILILGAGGKMGPALSVLAKAAIDITGNNKKVIAVSRFSNAGVQQDLESKGIKTIHADLLDDKQLQELPLADNVLYMAGLKFGSTENSALTWAMNSYLPGRVAEKYKQSNIVVFSTGNVYPMVPVLSGGATENYPTEPVGEYAQSCLGREKVFQYFSSLNNTPLLIYRLNYANDVSYGVLLEIALSVKKEKVIDLNMGHFNAIWQGDANEIALRSLHYCNIPAHILNVTGPETISVKWCAEEFGKLFGVQPVFTGEEQITAYLNNASEAFSLFGYPGFTLKSMIQLIAEWIITGGKTLNRPTHFQERKGKY